MNNNEFYLADAIDVIEEVLASGGDFRMFPKGTSMLPLIVQKRDAVTLKRNDSIPAKKHDIAFYRRTNGQFVLHRVMKIRKDGSYVMCGDNQTALEEGIRPEQIIAYVSGIDRKGRPLKMNGAAYRLYVFLWTLMPVRYFGIFAKRVRNKLARIYHRLFKKSA